MPVQSPNIFAVLIGAICAAALFPPHASAKNDFTEQKCQALTGVVIEAARLSLPTKGASVVSAQSVDTPAGGHYCKVEGAIHPVDPQAPDIRFRVALPYNWNEKALHFGGGGYDGSIPDTEKARFPLPGTPTPLQQGYATFGSDSGHSAGTGDAAAFASSREALANFAGDQLRKTHDTALVLINQAYGAAARRMYFQGNSQGGHEAFAVAQRWPNDYDGIVAIHPVYDFVALQVDGTLIGQTIYNHLGAWLSPAKAASLSTKVYEACDELDGLKDGVISDVRACVAHFKVDSLRCAGGTDSGETCLSDAQLAAVKTIASDIPLGVRFEMGDQFGKWPILEGGGAGNFSTFGRSATPSHPPIRGDSFLFMMGDQMVRHMAMRDPGYESLTFQPAAHAEALQALAKQVDNSSANLAAFRRHGGKLLLMHGTVDMAVTPYNTIAYYDRLKTQFKPDELRSFIRFYIVPGFGHGDGPFVVGWDSLGALDAWVDHGVEPASQTVVDTARATAGRSRPLCEYPGYPRYKGEGDPSSAASFTCAQ